MPKKKDPSTDKTELIAFRAHPQSLARWKAVAAFHGSTLTEYLTWIADRNADLLLGPRWRRLEEQTFPGLGSPKKLKPPAEPTED